MEKIKIKSIEFWALLGIVVLSLTLRLWRIGEYLTFLGDEGRDVRIVRDLILHGNLVFIGPQTSIGNMYLGPLYYYMMAPFLWLSGLNPVGPAIMNALLGTVSVVFVWYVGKKWFNPLAGFLAALLFALSPVAIIYSRSSWNPNPMPLFALLAIFGVWKFWQEKKFSWLMITGVSLAAALQMHYLGLLLLPTVGIFLLTTLRTLKKDEVSEFWKKSWLALVLFLFMMSPLVLFDIKHNGANFNAFKTFFSDRQTTVNLNPARSDRFMPAIESIVSELLLGRQLMYAAWGALVIAVIFLWAFLGKTKLKLREFLKLKKDPALLVLLVWIGMGIIGLGSYKQHIYAHYFGFLFPAVYLLVGYLLAFLWQKQLAFKAVSLALLAFMVYTAVSNSPLQFAPNRQLQRTEQVVDLIIQESDGKEFNFGLIAKQNYDESYRFFLENKKAKLVRGEERVVDQLFVVCEDGDKCQPEGNPQWQIAVFGPSHIDEQWSVDYIKVYRMVHSK